MGDEEKISLSLKNSHSVEVLAKGLNGFQALKALGIDKKNR